MQDSKIMNNFFTTELIANGEGRNVLSAIEDGLRSCDEFLISVAFITDDGLLVLKPILKELEGRGVKGRILTTDYLGFNNPKVLDELGRLKNIELRVYCTTNGSKHGFHTKGYIFKQEQSYQIIVGSSNLTINALKKNREWNTRAKSNVNDTYTKEVLEEFELYWNSEFTMEYSEFLPWYRPRWERSNRLSLKNIAEQVKLKGSLKLEPNLMQQQFIDNFNELRHQNESRGLLISATGTGKTYAAAFAMREMRPKRLLFLVHREQIANQALSSFQRVFDDQSISFGIVSGNVKRFDADYVFSTMQMMGRSEILQKYNPDDFDCIIIDEVHRAGAESYQRIIDYFKPKFLLGMTASPERTDGYDLYNLFHHNIVYEIRLEQALAEDLLCPFHYFGISDLWIDGKEINLEEDTISFSNLSEGERVDKIIEKIRYFGHSGSRVKGLVFCSNKKEAKELSDAFNLRKFRTISLTGDDSQAKREDAIARLTGTGAYQGFVDDQLDYIFTVDIFNEGVDIPEVNQVIMLRQTESPIVFIQQLGRGLRKFEDKEYVVILDFIGNYSNSYMIPLALSGDRSYNKDTLRKYVQSGNRIIPGTSTVHFDAIAKKRIFAAIDTANLSSAKLIKEAYLDLKYKLGHIPRIKDFKDYGSIDITKIFNKYKSYHHFLTQIKDKDYKTVFTPIQEQMLHFISQKLATGIRVRDLVALQLLISGECKIINKVSEVLLNQYGIQLSEQGKVNLINTLTNQFNVASAKKTFSECIFIIKKGKDYIISNSFQRALENDDFKMHVQELIVYGLDRYLDKYRNGLVIGTPFALYEKYNYEQVCQLLDWPHNESSTIGGYKYSKETKTLPIFINYDKDENIQESIKYEDRFVERDLFIGISKHPRTLKSKELANIFDADKYGICIHLFIRKNKNDKEKFKEFYYLGPIHSTGRDNAEEITMASDTKAVELEYRLDVPVRDDIYDYLLNG